MSIYINKNAHSYPSTSKRLISFRVIKRWYCASRKVLLHANSTWYLTHMFSHVWLWYYKKNSVVRLFRLLECYSTDSFLLYTLIHPWRNEITVQNFRWDFTIFLLCKLCINDAYCEENRTETMKKIYDSAALINNLPPS